MKRTLFLLGVCLLLSPATVKAGIIGVTGDAIVVSPPVSVKGTGTGADALVFVEGSGALSSPLHVDISAVGSYASLASLTPGTIPALTRGSSYYLHTFNSVDRRGTIYSGSITFSGRILGVEALSRSLVATNFLGSPTTIYQTTVGAQGYEFGAQIDSLVISASDHTLSFLNETFGASDDLRILVAAPEPLTIAMFGTGLAGLGALRRRRKAKG